MLQKGPQHLPSAGFLIVFAAALHLAISIVPAPLFAQSPVEALTGEVVYLGSSYLLVWLLLRFTGHPERINATLSGLIGSSAVITAVALPVMVLAWGAGADGQITGSQVVVLVTIVVWEIAVIAHILRQAANLNSIASVAIAVTYSLTYIRLMFALSPQPV